MGRGREGRGRYRLCWILFSLCFYTYDNQCYGGEICRFFDICATFLVVSADVLCSCLLIGKAVYVNGESIEGNFSRGRPHGILKYRFVGGLVKHATYDRGHRVQWTTEAELRVKSVLKWLPSTIQKDEYQDDEY